MSQAASTSLATSGASNYGGANINSGPPPWVVLAGVAIVAVAGLIAWKIYKS